MEVIKTHSFSRVGFLGNPSDGYFGKTISVAFDAFGVELTLTESSRIRFVPGEVDDQTFDSLDSLVHDVRLYGYYGGIRILKAVTKRFCDYCREHGLSIPDRAFMAEYKINVPRLVGLSGSSAICTAMLKALMRFYRVEIPLEDCPTICLEAEREELGIACGLQDRVIQMYNGAVFMDFDKDLVTRTGHGRYERLDVKALPKLYVAFDPNRAEESGKAHKKVKKLFMDKNSDVLSAMTEFADIAQKGRDAIVAGRLDELPALVDANFDLRNRIFDVAEENKRMVMMARSAGVSAKFAGSGGAIVGIYEDERQFAGLASALSGIGCTTLQLAPAANDGQATQSGAAVAWRNS